MYGCYTSVDVCAVRAATLDSDGSKLGATVNGGAYNLRPISITQSFTFSTGESFEQRDGCGNICFARSDVDVLTGADITLELCQLDLELISILTGGQVLLDPSGEVIGVESPMSNLTPPVVEFDFWTKAFDGNSPVAAPRTYWHWVFPFTQWTWGQWQNQRGSLVINLTGTASENANLGSGAFNDLPGAGVQGVVGVFLADDIPESDESPYNGSGLSCGFINLPASAS
jgi:hypothetical protein